MGGRDAAGVDHRRISGCAEQDDAEQRSESAYFRVDDDRAGDEIAESLPLRQDGGKQESDEHEIEREQ